VLKLGCRTSGGYFKKEKYIEYNMMAVKTATKIDLMNITGNADEYLKKVFSKHCV